MIVTTSNRKMTPDNFRKFLAIYQDFTKYKNITVDEYVEEKIKMDIFLTEEEIEALVFLVTHKSYLTKIKDLVIHVYNLKNYKESKILMTLFVLIFFIEETTADNLLELLKVVGGAYKKKILEFLCNERNLAEVALIGCKFFEDDYILKVVVHPLLNHASLFFEVLKLHQEECERRFQSKTPTIPDNLHVLGRPKQAPVVPLNTPADFPLFEAQKVPITQYTSDIVNRRLMDEYEKNKIKARKLLEEAQSLQKNYSTKSAKKQQISPAESAKFKARKLPSFEEVRIKDNIATVLRQGKTCIKETEKEIQDIENLLRGGGSLAKYKELEAEIRQLEQQKHLQDIEKKHLEGLLTFEEAVLARKRLQECNKLRFKEFMIEREEFLLKLQNWKEEEQEKMKLSIKKGQEIAENARKSEIKSKELKHIKANQIKEESRKLLEEALKRHEKEMSKKIKLISEIKTLHQLRKMQQIKDFDLQKSPDLGLLCQMSISELQENIKMMRNKMEEDLERKRRCIQKFRKKKTEMLEDVKVFIAHSKMLKGKQTLPKQVKLARNPDLDRLRGQLQHLRSLRKENAVINCMDLEIN